MYKAENTRASRPQSGSKARTQNAARSQGHRDGELDFANELPTHASHFPPSQHPLSGVDSDDGAVQGYERESHANIGEKADDIFPLTPAHINKINSFHKTRVSDRATPRRNNTNQSREATDVGYPDQNEVPIDPQLEELGSTRKVVQCDVETEISAASKPPKRKVNTGDGSGGDKKRRRSNQKNGATNPEQGTNILYDKNGEVILPEDQALFGLEDEKHRMSKNLGTPYTEDTDLDELRWQQQALATETKEVSTNKHGLTAEEIAQLERFRTSYCEESGMTLPQFNDLVQSNIRGNARAMNLFAEIQNLFPHRTRSYVQRFCRRRFHNFHARGKWTPQEDEELRRAVDQKGTSWKIVGEMLGRFAEDCRDRYRNYLVPSAQHRNRDAWTDLEVMHLSQAVLKCMGLVRVNNQRKPQNEIFDDAASTIDLQQTANDLNLINWQIVSELMDTYGSSRSRLQCSFKWGKIRERDRNRYLREVQEAEHDPEALEAGDYSANNMRQSNGWRMRRASKKVLNMRGGDRYEILRAILDSGAPLEENIPWRLIGKDSLRERWTTVELRAAWAMMREEIPDSDRMDWRDVINRLLTKTLSEGIDEKWDPEVHGWVEGSFETKRSKRDGGDSQEHEHEDEEVGVPQSSKSQRRRRGKAVAAAGSDSEGDIAAAQAASSIPPEQTSQPTQTSTFTSASTPTNRNRSPFRKHKRIISGSDGGHLTGEDHDDHDSLFDGDLSPPTSHIASPEMQRKQFSAQAQVHHLTDSDLSPGLRRRVLALNQ